MKILVLSQFYTPDITAAAFRVSETVDLMRSYGHEIRVITAEPHKSGALFNRQDDRLLGIVRVPIASEEGGGILRYLNHYLSFTCRSSVAGIKQRFGSWRPNIIWASSPPLFTGLTGQFLSIIFNCPLVFDVRDIWPESAVSAGQIRATCRAYRMGKMLEKFLYDNAQHITCVSKPMAAYISSRTRTPASVIYNGLAGRFASSTHAIVDKKRILYAGNLGRVQALDVPIRAFARLISGKAFEGWTLEFIGAGALKSEHESLAYSLGMQDRILFHAPVAKDAVMNEMARSALLLLNLKHDAVFKLTIPSKVFDYMSTGRPILFGIAGEGREILQSTGANIEFTSSNEDSLARMMQKAIEDIDVLDVLAKRNPSIVSGPYLRETSTQKLICIFNELTEAAR